MGKRVKRRNVIKKDRISELPEHLRHHILSYLSTREAAATTLVLSSWKDFWLTLPCFFLGEEFFSEIMQIYDILHEQLLDVVDQIFTKLSKCADHQHHKIMLKELQLHIPRLNLSGSDKIPDSTTCLLNKVIGCAVNEFGVKKLDFSFGIWEEFIGFWQDDVIDTFAKLPITCWKQESEITDLAFRGCALNSCIETSWSTLRCLSLKYVNLPDQQLFDSVTANCPLIESLEIWCCTGEFDTLNASLLKRLVRLCIIVRKSFKKIDMAAPNLEYFMYEDQSRTYKPCVIHDLTLSKGLKDLHIFNNTGINDEWLNHINIAHLSQLKRLTFRGCSSLPSV